MKKVAKKLEYMITPKGIIASIVDEEEASKIMNGLELQALRMDCNALLLDNNGWEFIRIERGN